MRTEVAHQPFALGKIYRGAFVVVVSEMTDEAHRRLGHRQQAAFHGTHGHAGAGVRVHDTFEIGPCAMEIARAEGLVAHERSVSLRLAKVEGQA